MGSLFRLARSVMAVRRSLARFICVSPGFDNVWVATSMRLAPPVPETGAMRDIAICVRPRAHLRWLRARGSIEKHVGTACRRGRGGHAPAQRAGRGESLDPDAHHQLFTRVYESLHRIARQQRARWKGNETLNATALVHEAYMKLVGGGGAYENRSHFLAVASRAMRHLLKIGSAPCRPRVGQ